jgi:PAS domain S-box-containing protein
MADSAPFTGSSKGDEVVINAARSRDDGQHAVIATDVAGRMVYWSVAAMLLYGWNADEVLGHNILDITPTRRSGDAAAEIMEDMRGGNEWSGEFIVKHRDGSPMLARVRNSIVRVGDTVVGVVGVSGLSTR